MKSGQSGEVDHRDHQTNKVLQAIPVEVALLVIIVSLSLCRFWWLRREKREKATGIGFVAIGHLGEGGAKISRIRPSSQPKFPFPLRCAQLLSFRGSTIDSLNLSNLPRPQPLHIIHIITLSLQ